MTLTLAGPGSVRLSAGNSRRPIPIPTPSQPRTVEKYHLLLRAFMKKASRGDQIAPGNAPDVRDYLAVLELECGRTIRPVRQGRHQLYPLEDFNVFKV